MERLDTNEKNERKKAMKILWLAAGLMAWTAGCGGKTKPGAPTAVKAVAGNGQATVSWTPPAGKLAVQSYLVTINYYVRSQHADLLSVPSQSSAVIPNLTNGTSYTFNVQAVDSSGTGPASDPSNAVVPAGTPDKPTQVSAVAGNGLAVVTFTAPALTGGVALISYEVTSSPEYRKATVKGNLATSAVVPGLTNGVSYTFTVVAANPVASGAPSDASNPVTPEASLSAPAIVLPSTLSNPTIPKGFTGKFMVTNHMLIQGGLPPLQSPPYDRWDEFYFVDCTNCSDGTHHANFEVPVVGTNASANHCPRYADWSVATAVYDQPFCYYADDQGIISADYISALPPGSYQIQLGFAMIQTAPGGPSSYDTPGPRVALIAAPGVSNVNSAYTVGKFTVTP